LHYISRK